MPGGREGVCIVGQGIPVSGCIAGVPFVTSGASGVPALEAGSLVGVGRVDAAIVAGVAATLPLEVLGGAARSIGKGLGGRRESGRDVVARLNSRDGHGVGATERHVVMGGEAISSRMNLDAR